MALNCRAMIALVALALPAAAWAETGTEAFDRRDYAAAAELWRAEAANGSPEAKFGLGLIHDVGLGVPRSSAMALRWYLEAAGDGFADAQFNVAVMFDAGTGVPRNPAAAATWYARAAANGHARAQYNLALLYETGTGVPRNLDLARAWHEAASASLAAAAERLAELPPSGQEASRGAAPQPVTGALLGPPELPRAELVWTAEPGAGPFQVQIARQPVAPGSLPGPADLLLTRDLEPSALALDLPPGEPRVLWRVGRGVGTLTGSTWSPWQRLMHDPVVEDLAPPVAAQPSRITILVGANDASAQAFAEELSGAFSRGGVEVAIRSADAPVPATTVEYRYLSDAPFAASVAQFLPALRLDSAVLVPASDTARGEVTVRLVGGPATASADGL